MAGGNEAQAKEQSDEAKRRLRSIVTMERVSNGYTVKIFPDLYVFTRLPEAQEFVAKYYADWDKARGAMAK